MFDGNGKKYYQERAKAYTELMGNMPQKLRRDSSDEESSCSSEVSARDLSNKLLYEYDSSHGLKFNSFIKRVVHRLYRAQIHKLQIYKFRNTLLTCENKTFTLQSFSTWTKILKNLKRSAKSNHGLSYFLSFDVSLLDSY